MVWPEKRQILWLKYFSRTHQLKCFGKYSLYYFNPGISFPSIYKPPIPAYPFTFSADGIVSNLIEKTEAIWKISIALTTVSTHWLSFVPSYSMWTDCAPNECWLSHFYIKFHLPSPTLQQFLHFFIINSLLTNNKVSLSHTQYLLPS